MSERLRRELDRFVAPSRTPDIPLRTVVVEGAPVTRILQEAGETGADLIVMGTHGAGGFERWVLGSVAEKVLRKAPCPVLTVSKGGKRRSRSIRVLSAASSASARPPITSCEAPIAPC